MDEAERLIRSGYRSISNRYRIVSRIDRPDWKEFMASRHGGDVEQGLRWIECLGLESAADHYRRVYSNDRLTLPENIFQTVRKAGLGFGWGGIHEYQELINAN